MLNFFRRKKKNIKEYINYIDENKFDFQFNIGCTLKSVKQNRVDIQVFRQNIIENFNYKVRDKNGYLLLLSFNDEKHNNLKNHLSFKQSSFYKDSIYVNMYGTTYLIKVDNKDNLINIIDTLLKNIFNYTNGTVIFTQFEKI